jgi:acyl-coenzyme A thioesterase PaaI-like protein
MSDMYQLEESGNLFLDAIGPIWAKKDSVYNIKIKIAQNHVRPKIPVAHGGILASMCDYAMAKSLVLNIDPALTVVTTSMSMDFIGSANIDDWVETDVNIIKSKGQVLNVECRLLCNGKTIARSSGVFLSIKK